jgi:hypothetical protein
MIEKKPFVNYTLDEDKVDSDSEVLTIRFNKYNREMLDHVKWLLCESKDATAIKYCIEWCRNDILGKFSEESWRKICGETRRKPVQATPELFKKK